MYIHRPSAELCKIHFENVCLLVFLGCCILLKLADVSENYLRHQGDDNGDSKFLRNIGQYQNAWCSKPEDSHLHTGFRINLKFHKIYTIQNEPVLVKNMGAAERWLFNLDLCSFSGKSICNICRIK